ncbi:TPA: M23 family peptidase, partial [Bacillus cereus]|nr:M23 family peptidase [Bacillus cereus]
MWKKFLLVIIVPFLIISWSLIYVANGVTSVFVWWCIQAFSVISVFLLIGSVIMFFF